jgi:hypothetical protein
MLKANLLIENDLFENRIPYMETNTHEYELQI